MLWGGRVHVGRHRHPAHLPRARAARRPAALIGGIGFGLFIDELGKFITADNDYFFKPAAGVIYVIFILMFLLIRLLARGRALSTDERAANAVYLAIDATHGRLHERERERAIALLAQADATDPLIVPLRDLLTGLRGLPTPPPRFYERWAEHAARPTCAPLRSPGFRPLVTTIFVIWAFSGLVLVLGAVFSVAIELGGARRGYESDALEDLGFLNAATTVCYMASTVCVAAVSAGRDGTGSARTAGPSGRSSSRSSSPTSSSSSSPSSGPSSAWGSTSCCCWRCGR